MLFADGTYAATVRDGYLYQRGEQERLSLALRLEIEGKEMKHEVHIELNDGTISERALKTLRECFTTWDGSIEALDAGDCLREVSVEVVIENEPGQKDPTKTYSRVKWMNPPGGSARGPNMPERASGASLAAKYGAKFRALSGGKPVAPTKPAAAKAPTKPAAKKTAPTATADECWAAMAKVNPLVPETEVRGKWFEFIELAAPGKSTENMTPEEFGKLKAHIEANPL